jgi:hypothetical protein
LHGSCISPCIEESTHGCAGLELFLFMSSIGNAALNHPASGNGAIPVLFHIGQLGRAVPEPGR